MRQLAIMAKAKLAADWDRTASVLACYINSNRKKGSKVIEPEALNPYRKQTRSVQPKIRLNSKDSMKLLKRVFIDHKPPNMEALAKGKIED